MSSPELDPFAALEQAASRQESEEKTQKLMLGARGKLVLSNTPESAFFASLVLKMEVKIDWDVPTMATDGDAFFVNPDWCNGLSNDERVAVLCHEVLHCVSKHHCRREGRDPEKWNEAADLSINQILVAAKFVLPKTRLMPGEGKYKSFPAELSAEEYYTLLSKPKEKKGGEKDEQGKPGDGGDKGDGVGDDGQPAKEGSGPKKGQSQDPGGCGAVRDAKDPAEAKDQEGKWEVAAAQAEQASKSRGDMSAGLSRLVGQALHPPADWKDILREFVSSQAKNDFSWSHPNRRFIAEGIYLPGMRSQELGEVIIAVDTSGSVGQKELETFGSEIEGILGAFDCSATIVYHDDAVTRVDEWTSADGPLVLNPVGGGGTNHKPVFDWIERENRSPACVICLTDLYTKFPDAIPEAPTLWAVIGENKAQPPFGRAIKVTTK